MLIKLSISSMRKMIKDYMVLLFGLVISISIFYMFQTLSQNREFIEANSLISSIVFVFNVGTFILATITIFYIFYATSFILSLRQKELGMYMMLGAKKSKVTQLMFFETLSIGLVSIVIGIALGSGLANVMAELLMNLLGFSADGFKPVYLPSMITTIIFYVILFVLTSFANAAKVAAKTVLAHLKADEQSEEIARFGLKTFITGVLGIIFLAVGYYALINMEELRELGVILSAVTTTAGTYLTFISLLPFFVSKLKKNRKLNETGLNSFTLAQLRFRVKSLSRVLGTVAMLIALGVGALAGGLAFYHNVELQATYLKANDIVIHAPTEEDRQLLKEMAVSEEHEYRYKYDDQAVYLLKDDLLENPPLFLPYAEERAEIAPVRVSEELPEDEYSLFSGDDDGLRAIPDDWRYAIFTELNMGSEFFGSREILVLNAQGYDEIAGTEQSVLVAIVDDFSKYMTQLRMIEERQIERAIALTGQYSGWIGSKYSSYINMKVFSGGTIFMGFFLGVAFLMMMASVLMFKLLSGAGKDIKRYTMLRKIGVRKSLLIRSIYKEMFLVFAFPALLGLVHVLVGMNMFSFILVEPYVKIWIPLVIFFLIYSVYYMITVQLYKGIVLPREK